MSTENLNPAKTSTAVNREHWLELAVSELRTAFFAPIGETVPEVRVSVGFPYASKKAIGQHWASRAVKDGKNQVFVSPVIDCPVRALDILVHELIHAIVPDAGHGKPFKRIALAVGLTGKMTATVAGEELAKRLNALSEKLGPFPQSAIVPGESTRKKQTTRMIKCECSECGYIARTSTQWLETIGPPLCACNQEPMGVKQ